MLIGNLVPHSGAPVSRGGVRKGTVLILGMFDMGNVFGENDIFTEFLIDVFCI